MENDKPVSVEERFDKVDQRLDRMDARLQRLAVMSEHHDEQIQRIAEVQLEQGKQLGEHGKQLGQIGKQLGDIKDEVVGVKGALKPLPAIHDFVKRIAGEHEARIAALEKGAEGVSAAPEQAR
jgi:hypothetical protein